MKKIILATFLTIFVLSNVVWAKDITTVEKKTVEKNVLIAVDSSNFKNTVISKIIKNLEKEAVVKTVPLTKLLKEDPSNYQAIVLTNTCWAGNVNGTVKVFLKKLSDQDKKKVIVFTSAGGEDWSPSGLGCDCVTSASTMSKTDSIAETISLKVRKILK